jgi:hypothetical protein
MPLSHRENYLRTASFSRGTPPPEHIPISAVISGASWDQLRGDLEDVLVRHPLFFPGFRKGQHDYSKRAFGPANRANEHFTDAWGCVWYGAIDGIEGQVVRHPLDDWSQLDAYQVPDPLVAADRGPADWEAARRRIAEAKARGDLTSGGLAHGFLFMRLSYLRGFENLMLDLATRDPRLPRLIERVNAHNKTIVRQWLDMGVDVAGFPEDLGSQTASVVGPRHFDERLAPAYKELMAPCRAAGAHVHMHSDGYIMDIADAILDCGVTILNPQDLCNGIAAIARELKGRVCIELDVDRQSVVPFGTARDIHDLIEEEVRKLGSPRGGLMMIVGIYPPTPAANVHALLTAFEKHRTHWWS